MLVHCIKFDKKSHKARKEESMTLSARCDLHDAACVCVRRKLTLRDFRNRAVSWWLWLRTVGPCDGIWRAFMHGSLSAGETLVCGCSICTNSDETAVFNSLSIMMVTIAFRRNWYYALWEMQMYLNTLREFRAQYLLKRDVVTNTNWQAIWD